LQRFAVFDGRRPAAASAARPRRPPWIATINRDLIFYTQTPIPLFSKRPYLIEEFTDARRRRRRRRQPHLSSPSHPHPSIPSVTGGSFDRERAICRLRPMHASSPSVALVWPARTRCCLRLRRANADGVALCRLALSGSHLC
jgi:hypothetical protein